MIKRILIITITVIIAITGFLTGFFSVGCMSVYAAVNDDSVYVPLRSENDAVKAFQAYCKSRDLTIEGSLTDAVTTFTTGAFNSACNEIGIDITELQAEIKAEYDESSKPVKFLFNDTGVMAMNRIFSQFLQDNELSVGDEDVNKLAYSGHIVTDTNGNSVLCYVTSSNFTNAHAVTDFDYIGTKYLIGGIEVKNLLTTTPVDYNTYFKKYGSDDLTVVTFSKGYKSGFSSYCYQLTSTNDEGKILYGLYATAYNNVTDQLTYNGDLCVIYNSYNNTYWLGSYSTKLSTGVSRGFASYKISVENSESATVSIISLQINNNVYEGDTIINNDGDIINNPQPQQPNNPNDTIHNVPETPLTPDGEGGWDIDLPDIDIPNLPIGNLSEKFPFSIPWDLVAFYAMLDADPEAPRFNGTMDLTLVQWNYDIDLSPFDSAAELCRKLQFGLFVVGLIVASRSIIRG